MARPAEVAQPGVADRAFRRMDPAVHAELRRRMVFEGSKWDPQVGDVDVIGRDVLVLDRREASELAAAAEALARDALRLEAALAARPDLHARLGLPRGLRGLCALAPKDAPPDHPRVMRFDFHPTDAGWRVSEVNQDVPGGFAEAGTLARLAAALTGWGEPGPDPAAALAAAVARRCPDGGRVAMVHATAFSDDRQVMEHLGRALRARGLDPVPLAPDHLRWRDGRPSSIALGAEGALDAVVRFFPAEWMPELPRASGWAGYFSGRVPQCNPPSAVLAQSKRAPLLAPELEVELPAFQRWMPAAAEPSWRTLADGRWVLKSAWGRVGEGVLIPGCATPGEARRMRVAALVDPRGWVMQARFDSRPLASADGPLHLCLGVHVVDGRACGFYGRASRAPRIDKNAYDVAVLWR